MGNATRSARNAANTDFDDFLAAQSGQDVPEVEGANFVKLMQSNSPEVDQHSANKKRVKDIQIGDFLFRGDPGDHARRRGFPLPAAYDPTGMG